MRAREKVSNSTYLLVTVSVTLKCYRNLMLRRSNMNENGGTTLPPTELLQSLTTVKSEWGKDEDATDQLFSTVS